jgi:hypothetical protein
MIHAVNVHNYEHEDLIHKALSFVWLLCNKVYVCVNMSLLLSKARNKIKMITNFKDWFWKRLKHQAIYVTFRTQAHCDGHDYKYDKSSKTLNPLVIQIYHIQVTSGSHPPVDSWIGALIPETKNTSTSYLRHTELMDDWYDVWWGVRA